MQPERHPCLCLFNTFDLSTSFREEGFSCAFCPALLLHKVPDGESSAGLCERGAMNFSWMDNISSGGLWIFFSGL